MPEALAAPEVSATEMEYFAIVLLLLGERRLERTAAWHPVRVGLGVAVALFVSVPLTLFGLAGVVFGDH